MKNILKSKTFLAGLTAIVGAVVTGLETGVDAKTIAIGALGALMIVLRRLTKEPVRLAKGGNSIVGSLLAVVLVQMTMVAHGCTDPYGGPSEGGGCAPVSSVRCIGGLSQMCSIEQRWETLYDCDEYGMICSPESGDCHDVDAGADGDTDD